MFEGDTRSAFPF